MLLALLFDSYLDHLSPLWIYHVTSSIGCQSSAVSDASDAKGCGKAKRAVNGEVGRRKNGIMGLEELFLRAARTPLSKKRVGCGERESICMCCFRYQPVVEDINPGEDLLIAINNGLLPST